MRSSKPSGTFATPARRAAFIAAMHAHADRGRSGPPVVYLAASRHRQMAPDWTSAVEQITAALPAGVWLDAFADAFPGARQYRDHWNGYAADLDGLVAFGEIPPGQVAGGEVALGERNVPGGYLLGPGTRAEVQSVIGFGRPVLLFAPDRGLIPIVDCRVERTGDPARPSLRVSIPPSWTPTAPTLHAALQALSPTITSAPSPRIEPAPH